MNRNFEYLIKSYHNTKKMILDNEEIMPPNINIELELKLILDPRGAKYNQTSLHKFSKNNGDLNIFSADDAFKISQKIFEELYLQDLSKPPLIEQTITFIKNKLSSSKEFKCLNKKLYFTKGIQDKDKKEYFEKTSIIKPFNLSLRATFPLFKTTLSKEMIFQSDIEINQFDIIRFKYRYSFTIQSLINWRIDFTIIKNLYNGDTTNILKIKEIKNALFAFEIKFIELKDDSQISNIKEILEYSDKIEIEFEYIGDLDILNYDAFSEDIKVIDSLLSNLYDVNTHSVKINESFNINIFNILHQIDDLDINKQKPKNNTLKKILPNPIELNRSQYYDSVLPNIDSFWITDKADGIRTVLKLTDGGNFMLVEFSNSLDGYKSFKLNCETLLKMENTITDVNVLKQSDLYIFDCELIKKNIEDKEYYHFYIFDIIKYNNINVSEFDFDRRYSFMEKSKKILHQLSSVKDNFQFNIKKFIKLNKVHFSEDEEKEFKSDSYDNQIINFYKQYIKAPSDGVIREYNVDGMIFNSSEHSYLQTKFYKWKPTQHMSIDFIAKKCPHQLVGVYPHIKKSDKPYIYILFSAISINDFKKLNLKKIQYYNKMFSNTNYSYFPIQFCPSDNPYAYIYWSNRNDLSNKVLELSFDNQHNEWVLLKIRNDLSKQYAKSSYYGNYFKVAELIWRNYKNPLTLQNLVSSREDIQKTLYFHKKNSKKHDIVRKYNNMVKNKLIQVYKNTNFVIDLCSGKGQDLFKYIHAGIENVLFIDNNEDNLCEIINRKYNFVNSKQFKNNKVSVYIQNLDLNASFKDNIKILKKSGIPIQDKIELIVCNFGIHYLIGNEEKIGNLAKFLKEMLIDGGRFIFTCLNGLAVHKLLCSSDSDNGEWGDKEKYFIKKMYNSNKFTGTNQLIDILLPFSDKLMNEQLVNLNKIKKVFEKNKLRLESNNSFIHYMDLFEKQYPTLFKEMDELDKMYISLHSYMVYIK